MKRSTPGATGPAALAERTRTAAHITTTGSILRTALEHTLHRP
ncbi:hypothetical protein ACFWBC_32585 [Streptomyces sp. NPDC059985]